MSPTPRPGIAEEMLDRLIESARAVRLRAHAPYSRFQVGAALLCEDGEVFVGCNVENVSFSLTICAERVAAASAVATQRRRWTAIVVASRGAVTPCGACRQFLAEFSNDLQVICVDAVTPRRDEHMLSALLPHAFDRCAVDPMPLRYSSE